MGEFASITSPRSAWATVLSNQGQQMWPELRGIVVMKPDFVDGLSTLPSVLTYTLLMLHGQIVVLSLLRSSLWQIQPKVGCALFIL